MHAVVLRRLLRALRGLTGVSQPWLTPGDTGHKGLMPGVTGLRHRLEFDLLSHRVQLVRKMPTRRLEKIKYGIFKVYYAVCLETTND